MFRNMSGPKRMSESSLFCTRTPKKIPRMWKDSIVTFVPGSFASGRFTIFTENVASPFLNALPGAWCPVSPSGHANIQTYIACRALAVHAVIKYSTHTQSGRRQSTEVINQTRLSFLSIIHIWVWVWGKKEHYKVSADIFVGFIFTPVFIMNSVSSSSNHQTFTWTPSLCLRVPTYIYGDSFIQIFIY